MKRSTSVLLKAKSFPKAVMDLNFGNADKIVEGATAVDVAGWIAEDRQVGQSVITVTQTTAAAQPKKVTVYDPIGAELVVNGAFDTDTDWTKGAGWSIGSGVGSSDGTQAGFESLAQNRELVVGTKYIISGEIKTVVSGDVRILADNTDIPVIAVTAPQTLTYTITPSSTTVGVGFRCSPDFVGTVDNISVKLAVENNSKSHLLFGGDDSLSAGLTDFGNHRLFADSGEAWTIIQKFHKTNNESEYLSTIAADNSSLRQFGIVANTNNSADVGIFLRGFNNEFTPPSVVEGVDNTISVTWDGTTAKVYWNSVFLQNLTVGTSVAQTAIPLLLGARSTDALGAAFQFNGKMFNTLIYAEALTATEIASKTASLA